MKIAVVSGKGGSGKSSVTAALVSLAEQVVAVDCDVDASNLPLLFPHEVICSEDFASGTVLRVDPSVCTGCGKCVQDCSYEALERNPDGSIRIHDLFCEGCGLCERLCPVGAISLEVSAGSKIYTSRFAGGTMIHGEMRPGDDNSGKMVTRIREIADLVMEKSGTALQILDGPPGIGCPVLSTLIGMDRTLLVCEPTVSGMSDMERIFSVAHHRGGRMAVVINKYDICPSNTRAIEDWCAAAGLPVIGRLPFDKVMVDAQVQGKSIIEYFPHCRCSEVLHDIFRKINC